MKAVLFDLDGTLLPLEQDVFIQTYFDGLVKHLAPHGYDPDTLVRSIWAGTKAMIQNDGAATNEEVFWNNFAAFFRPEARRDEPLFDEYYRTEFQKVREVCGCDPMAKTILELLHSAAIPAILATNPLFPAVATHSRIRWAGLQPEDFALITTYDNSRHCKPNLAYYRDILEQLDLDAADCIMVGNDVDEDMIAQQLGMKVFLLTDHLLNKKDTDITRWPHGGFDSLHRFLKEALF